MGYEAINDLSDLDLLEGLVNAWPNKTLKGFLAQPVSELRNPIIHDMLSRSREQYGSAIYGSCMGLDSKGITAEETQVEVPVLAFACMWEEKAGETSDRVKRWQ